MNTTQESDPRAAVPTSGTNKAPGTALTTTRASAGSEPPGNVGATPKGAAPLDEPSATTKQADTLFLERHHLTPIKQSEKGFEGIGEYSLSRPVTGKSGGMVAAIRVRLSESITGRGRLFELTISLGEADDEFRLRKRLSYSAKSRPLALQILDKAFSTLERIAREHTVESALALWLYIGKQVVIPPRISSAPARLPDLAWIFA